MTTSERSWLTELAIAAALSRQILVSRPVLGRPEFALTNPESGAEYAVFPLIAQNSRYRTRICMTPDGRVCAMKIATSIDHNNVIDREAYLLQRMRRIDDEVPDEKLRTRSFFPEVVDSFNAGPEQGNRMVLVVGFAPEITHMNQLKVLKDLIEVDKSRVDVRTFAWMWGKVLKIIGFAHEHGMVNGAIDTQNVLLETSMHGVIIFDWSHAHFTDSEREKRAEIKNAALATLAALEITSAGKLVHKDEYLDRGQQSEFEEYFRRILSGEDRRSAYEIKDTFYDMIWRFWPKEFYLFTAFDRM